MAQVLRSASGGGGHLTTEANPSPPSTHETADLLRLVLTRLDGLERKVDRLAAVAEPVPALVSGAVDTLDDVIRAGQARGIDVDARLSAGVHLLERLSHPQVSAPLARILERAEVLSETVHHLAELPALSALAGDMADAWVHARQAEGVDLDASVRAAGDLLRTLSRPDVSAALRSLAERLPELARFADDAPKLAAMMMDGLDELSARAAAGGLEVDEAIRSFLTVGVRLTEVLDSPQFKALIASDVLAPETLEVVGRAGRALATQSNEACGQTGLLGALGAARDPDVQRALNFVLGFARSFGRNMDCAAALPDGR